jgi:hypothetical protein
MGLEVLSRSHLRFQWDVLRLRLLRGPDDRP